MDATNLHNSYDAGIQKALEIYGLKNAGFLGRIRQEWNSPASDIRTQQAGRAAFQPGGSLRALTDIGHSFTGDPYARKQLYEGKAFQPGGALDMKHMLWPSAGGGLQKWMGRAQTGFGAYDAYKALKGESGDPREGKLTNALASVGGTAGNLLGYPVGGLIGSSLLSGVGRRVGTGLGRMLGSSAPPQQQPQQEYYP